MVTAALDEATIARELAEPDAAAALSVLTMHLSRHPNGTALVPLPWQPIRLPGYPAPAYVAELVGGRIVATPEPRQRCNQPGRDGRCRVCRRWPPLWTFTG